MRWGLIARADESGLGIQTWEIYRHLNPDKVLVIDLDEMADDRDHCNKHVDLSRYPGALVNEGPTPSPHIIEGFLEGLDLVFTCETFYTYDLLNRANHRGIKTILQYNYEFLDYLRDPHLPRPTLLAAPSLWNYFRVHFSSKIHLPVPIATEVFTPNPDPPATARRFLHPVGRPATHDRNGTKNLIAALRHVRTPMTIRFSCQRTDTLDALLADAVIPHHVEVIVAGPAKNYWDNYADVDAVILPRRYGGLCLPANESLGAHLPVLMPNIDPNNRWLPADWLYPATPSGGFEARAHIDVYKSPPVSLARTIDRFATDPDLYKKAKDQARELAGAMSWETLAPQYRRIFSKLVDKA